MLTHTGPLQLCRAMQDALRLGLGDAHFCLAQHHMAPKLATGVYWDPARQVSIRVADGHFACHGRHHPRSSAVRETWPSSCASGIEHCPCVWRDDSELIVNAKYNFTQYQLDLRKMRTRYYG